MGLAIFATAFGLDSNTSWGTGRFILLTAGISLTLCAMLYSLQIQIALEVRHGIQSFIENLALTSWLRKNQDITYLSKLLQEYLYTLPVVCMILLVYLWLAGSGPWADWPARKGTNYYQLQAQAFQNGKLYLPVEPAPELLQLPNPYDPEERRGITIPLDISLYKGKFYLYWGPVPALILAAPRPIHRGAIDDRGLTVGFLCGTFLFQVLLILALWDRFFHDLPQWILVISTALAGLVLPATWLASTGGIYEAAIAGGQFFLMGGFVLALAALDRASPSAWRLALASALWALAIGTRNVLIVPIGFIVLVSVYWIYKPRDGSAARPISTLIALGSPLAVGAICLGWYNWARFGSMTETGFSYALAGPYLQKYSSELFSASYIFQNLYNYLLVPFTARAEFPFIQPTRGNLTAIFPFYPLPPLYFTNLITGLLCTVPFIVFSILPAGQLGFRLFKRETGHPIEKDSDTELFRWIIICLTSCGLAAFGTLQLFFWAAMRYMQDFMPALMLLSLVGFWQGYQLLAPKTTARILYTIFGIILALASSIISILLAISAHLIFLL